MGGRWLYAGLVALVVCAVVFFSQSAHDRERQERTGGIEGKPAKGVAHDSAGEGVDRLGVYENGDPLVHGRQSVTMTSGERESVKTARTSIPVRGTVVLDAPIPEGSQVRVRFGLLENAGCRWLGAEQIEAAGPWGPVQVPYERGVSFRFLLDGGGFVPEAVDVSDADGTSELVVDLQGVSGHDLWFHVVDPEGKTLEKAEVVVRWLDGPPPRLTSAKTGEHGYIQVRGCRTGRVVPEASCPGFVPQMLAPVSLPQAELEGVLVTLKPAGTISGRCIYVGQPVQDFDLVFWPANHSEDYAREAVRNAEDGRFRLSEAPKGEVQITAFKPGLGPSDVKSIRVGDNGAEEILLELVKPLRGRGRVIDLKGSPIPDAETSLWIQGTFVPLGKTTRVRSDGTFEVQGLSTEAVTLVVQAAGYAPARRTEAGTHGEVLDYGSIVLTEAFPLELSIVSTSSRPFDPRRFTVRSQDSDMIAVTRFSEAGRLTFEDIPPGALRLAFECPGTYGHFNAYSYLNPGQPEDWNLEVPVDAPRTLIVETRDAPDYERPHRIDLFVEYMPDDVLTIERFFPLISGEEQIVAEGIAAEGFEVTAFQPDGMMVGLARGSFSGRREEVIQLVLGKNARRLRVVDESGKPVPGAYLYLGTRAFGVVSAESDGEGELVLAGLPQGELLARLVHVEHGCAVNVRVPPSIGGEITEIVFPKATTMELFLKDWDEPAVGFECNLSDPHLGGTTRVDTKTTDELGRVSWRVSPGEFELRASHPDYFFVIERVRAGTGAPQEVQVRRTGNLEFRTVSLSTGLGVSGARLDLVSEERGVDVRHWIETHFVKHEGDLVTDLRGVLRVEGIPHGPYSWTLHLPSGETREGEVIAAPAASTIVRVELP